MITDVWQIKGQGATKRIHIVKMYAKKFVVYTKFLEAVQSFARQYNMFLLSLVYPDPAFFIG